MYFIRGCVFIETKDHKLDKIYLKADKLQAFSMDNAQKILKAGGWNKYLIYLEEVK